MGKTQDYWQSRVVLITGGGRGIGEETALELARRGATVAIADRKLDLAEETAARCMALGVRARAFSMDQAVGAEVETCVGEVVAAFGAIDLLFANAGTGGFSTLVDMSRADWDRCMQINLSGTFYVAQAVAKQMIAAGRGGRMVFSASSGARVIADQLGAYCVSKAGVEMLMKHLASELGNYRIGVNAILPGVIQTAMTAPMLSRPEWQRMVQRETPAGRWGTPAEVAKLVAFLLSDDAGYINGEGIMIDGGSTLHGAPRWYATDYTTDQRPDWDRSFSRYPYSAE